MQIKEISLYDVSFIGIYLLKIITFIVCLFICCVGSAIFLFILL